MKLFVRYARDGTILSVLTAEVLPEGQKHPFGLLEEGESVTEQPLADELSTLTPLQIHEQYRVEVKQRKARLVKKG